MRIAKTILRRTLIVLEDVMRVSGDLSSAYPDVTE